MTYFFYITYWFDFSLFHTFFHCFLFYIEKILKIDLEINKKSNPCFSDRHWIVNFWPTKLREIQLAATIWIIFFIITSFVLIIRYVMKSNRPMHQPKFFKISIIKIKKGIRFKIYQRSRYSTFRSYIIWSILKKKNQIFINWNTKSVLSKIGSTCCLWW